MDPSDIRLQARGPLVHLTQHYIIVSVVHFGILRCINLKISFEVLSREIGSTCISIREYINMQVSVSILYLEYK